MADTTTETVYMHDSGIIMIIMVVILVSILIFSILVGLWVALGCQCCCNKSKKEDKQALYVDEPEVASGYASPSSGYAGPSSKAQKENSGGKGFSSSKQHKHNFQYSSNLPEYYEGTYTQL